MSKDEKSHRGRGRFVRLHELGIAHIPFTSCKEQINIFRNERKKIRHTHICLHLPWSLRSVVSLLAVVFYGGDSSPHRRSGWWVWWRLWQHILRLVTLFWFLWTNRLPLFSLERCLQNFESNITGMPTAWPSVAKAQMFIFLFFFCFSQFVFFCGTYAEARQNQRNWMEVNCKNQDLSCDVPLGMHWNSREAGACGFHGFGEGVVMFSILYRRCMFSKLVPQTKWWGNVAPTVSLALLFVQ